MYMKLFYAGGACKLTPTHFISTCLAQYDSTSNLRKKKRILKFVVLIDHNICMIALEICDFKPTVTKKQCQIKWDGESNKIASLNIKVWWEVTIAVVTKRKKSPHSF